MLTFLRSLLYYVGIAPSTVFIGIVGPLMRWLRVPFGVRYFILSGLWTRFAVWWVGVSCGLRYRVEGHEHIPASGAGIILSKHQSAWETMALQAIFPPQVWVLKKELYWVPFFGWALASLDPIAIDRKAGRKALKILATEGADRLKRGIWVVVFPEGTRTAPGERRPYQAGGAMLARDTGATVVPVGHNAGSYWPKGSFLKHPGTIVVKVGAPIDPRGLTVAEINARAEAWIESNSNG